MAILLSSDKWASEQRKLPKAGRFYKDKRISLPRRHMNTRYMGIKRWSCQIYEKKLIELKGEIYKSTITVGEYNTHFVATDRTTIQENQQNIE